MHDVWVGAADSRRKHDGDAQSHAYSASQLRTDAVAARCDWVRDSRTPSCYSTNAPLHARSASTCHATQMKSDIRILTGFSLSISGFWKKFDINITNYSSCFLCFNSTFLPDINMNKSFFTILNWIHMIEPFRRDTLVLVIFLAICSRNFASEMLQQQPTIPKLHTNVQ